VPKLNFSKSARNRHDEWMQPHASPLVFTWTIDRYWDVAADLIKELVEVCRPETFFHIGMDEDHSRSLDQFVDAIERLRGIVAKQGLKTMIWSDAAHDSMDEIAQVHAQKCKAAEPLLSTDITQVLWHYRKHCPDDVARLRQRGFDVWAAPGQTAPLVADWKDAVEKCGGNGLLMTQWLKCSGKNEAAMLKLIRELGSDYS
jgi:hypothetical protein